MKIRSNEIRKIIKEKLELSSLKAYYERTTTEPPFPYIVFSLNRNDYDVSSIYDLEVNIWDDRTDKTVGEDVADAIEDEFMKLLHISDTGLLCFTQFSRGYVDDPNDKLTRLMLKFNVEYYK